MRLPSNPSPAAAITSVSNWPVSAPLATSEIFPCTPESSQVSPQLGSGEKSLPSIVLIFCPPQILSLNMVLNFSGYNSNVVAFDGY